MDRKRYNGTFHSNTEGNNNMITLCDELVMQHIVIIVLVLVQTLFNLLLYSAIKKNLK